MAVALRGRGKKGGRLKPPPPSAPGILPLNGQQVAGGLLRRARRRPGQQLGRVPLREHARLRARRSWPGHATILPAATDTMAVPRRLAQTGEIVVAGGETPLTEYATAGQKVSGIVIQEPFL